MRQVTSLSMDSRKQKHGIMMWRLERIFYFVKENAPCQNLG